MATTLLQVAQASESNLRAGIVEHIIETSPLLARLQFVEAPSLRYEWSAQKSIGAASFRALNGAATVTDSTYDRGRVDLKPLSTEIRIDRLLADIPDLNRQAFIASEIRARSRSISMQFKNAFVNGNSPRSFDGLKKMFDDGTLTQQVNFAASGSTIAAAGASTTIQKLHELINSCIVTPSFLVANRTVISHLAALSLATAANNAFAQYFQMTTLDIGNGRTAPIGQFNGIPIIPLDTDETGAEIMSFNEASPDNSVQTCTSIYACVSGDGFLVGVQQFASGPSVFEFTTDNGHKAVSIDWPTAIAVEHPRAVARLRGILA